MAKPKYHKQSTKKAQKKREELKRKSFTWRPEPGKNLIRVMPPYKEGGDFWFDFAKHYQIGPSKKSFLCRQAMLSKRCFLCEMAASLRDSENQDERDMASQIRPVKRSMINIVDLSSKSKQQEGPQPYEAPGTVIDAILAYYDGEEDDIVDVVDPVNGYNLKLEKTGSGLETRYQVSLRPKPAKLDDMEWLANLHDLETVLGDVSSNEEMEAAWEGRDADDGDDDPVEDGGDDTPDDDPEAKDDSKRECFGKEFEEDDEDDCDDCEDREECKKKFQEDQEGDGEDDELGEPIESDLEADLKAADKAAKAKKPKKPKKLKK